MKFALPLLLLFPASAAMAHGSGHLHPHEANGLMLALFLVPVVGLTAYALYRLRK